MFKEYDKKVLDLISNSKEPLSQIEVAKQLHMIKPTIHNSIKRLKDDNQVIEIPGKKRKFYITKKDTTNFDLSNMNQIIMEKTAYAKDNYEDLEEKFSIIDSKINNLYANIITLMGIFVAIFSLISSNAKVVFDLTQESINVRDITISVIIMNLVTIFSIIVLLIGIHFLIKNKKRY